jgi:hypothetical protein
MEWISFSIRDLIVNYRGHKVYLDAPPVGRLPRLCHGEVSCVVVVGEHRQCP